jgi:hypothetical protein
LVIKWTSSGMGQVKFKMMSKKRDQWQRRWVKQHTAGGKQPYIKIPTQVDILGKIIWGHQK